MAAYISQLTPMEQKVLKIAASHLETSFSLVKSIGYQEWQAQPVQVQAQPAQVQAQAQPAQVQVQAQQVQVQMQAQQPPPVEKKTIRIMKKLKPA